LELTKPNEILSHSVAYNEVQVMLSSFSKRHVVRISQWRTVFPAARPLSIGASPLKSCEKLLTYCLQVHIKKLRSLNRHE